MQIKYQQDNFLRAGFIATPEEQDGFPRVAELYASLAPTWFSGGRRALAGALSNLTYVSGKLSVDQKFAPLTAELVRSLLPSSEVFINTENIDFKPTDIQKGGSTLHVKSVSSVSEGEEFHGLVRQIDGGVRQTSLSIIRNDGLRGYFSTPTSRSVSSNYWLVEALDSSIQQIYSLAALALMYSEDLSAAKIVFHTSLLPDEQIHKVLRESFYSVGINLEIRNEA